jgi:predicted dinucleotide-binding enzyme
LPGHNLILASRNPDDDKAKAAVKFVASEGASGTVKSASFLEAKASKIDVLIVAIPGQVSPAEWTPVFYPLGDLEGVVVIDASNPVRCKPSFPY